MADVFVGFPVYNGAATIEESMRCILDGSYRDIQVVVSDNGSTDDTVSIVKAVAQQDKRVSLIQQPHNLGAVGNFRFLVDLASTPFFLWRAHDDLSGPDYIEKLRNELLSAEGAVLAAPHILTSKTNRKRERPFSPKLNSGEVATWHHLPHVQAAWIYGLFRTQFARDGIANTQNSYDHLYGWDMVMLLQALLDGGVVGTNGAHFTQRILAPSGPPAQKQSKQIRRQIGRDFYRSCEQLADRYGIVGLKRNVFRIFLLRYISRRVIRWHKFI